MKPATYLPVAYLATTALAVPLSRRTDDAGPSDAGAVTGTVNELLLDLCKSIDGSMLTSTVCTTATSTDVSVGAATENGLATVVISGAGLLQGASITVPVASAEGILGQLSKRHIEPVCVVLLAINISPANLLYRSSSLLRSATFSSREESTLTSVAYNSSVSPKKRQSEESTSTLVACNSSARPSKRREELSTSTSAVFSSKNEAQ